MLRIVSCGAPLEDELARERTARAKAERLAQAGATAPLPEIAALLAEIAKLKTQNAGLQTRIKNLRIEVNVLSASGKGTVMTKSLHKEIRAHLHPDANFSAARKNKVFQAFDVLKINLVDDA